MESILLTALLHVLLTPIPLAAEAPSLPLVSWEEYTARPDLALGELRRMVVQYAAPIDEWEPYLTRYSPEAYVSLRAWSDSQEPWMRADYDAPAARLFVRRGTRAATLVQSLERHDRIVVACVVHDQFLGRAWVEVVSARRMRQYVPEGSVLHAVKGLEFLERGVLDLARDQFARALAAPLPSHAREALARLVGRCEISKR